VTQLLAAAAVTLLVSLAIGFLRVLRGPSPEDRMLAVQLLGTAGVGLLAVLTPLLGVAALVDVALVLALLAAVATAAFTGREAGGEPPP
jgi:multicomponent Na+:H+ antiporter subunit F